MQTQHAELSSYTPLLLQIYLRVPLHAREDLAEWRSILQNIMESSATATRLVLVTLAHPDAHRRQPLLEDTILINSGEVREFASGVVHDALKIAVTLHHGAFDPSTEIPEDSMPAAVNNMVDALLQAGLALLRDDRSLDQAYFAQLLLLFRDYGCLGQLQKQHLANLPHIFEFAAQIMDSVYTYPASVSQQCAELQAALLLLAMLMRLLDLTPLLTSGRVAADNPYKYSDVLTVSPQLLTPGVVDAIPHMCRVELFAEQAVRETLQYLSWENSELSVKILDAVFAICKKADVQSLYQLAPHYAALVGLEDSLRQPRLQYFLVARRGVHENGPGIAGLLLPNRANRQPWRRLALFRLMHAACRDSPEVVAKIIKSFPDVISHENITGTYHALAQDTVSSAMMLEIRSFLQDLLDLEARHTEG